MPLGRRLIPSLDWTNERGDELSRVFARNGRQGRCRSRLAEARTDSREAVCRADDRATLLLSCLPVPCLSVQCVVRETVVGACPWETKREMSSAHPGSWRAFLERDDGHAGPRANPIPSS